MLKAAGTTVVLMVVGAAPSFASEYLYADLTDSRRQFILHEASISAGGPPSPAKYCAPNSAHICFSSGGLKFAVPRRLGSLAEWTYDGAQYRVQKQAKFSVVGIPVEAVFIEQVSDDQRIVFVFSEHRGLIAMSIGGRASRSFVLESSCGFGASSDCKQGKDR